MSQRIVTAQGAALFRVLSQEEQDSLRFYEVVVVDEMHGSRLTPLKERSFHYFGVTDTMLHIVEFGPSAPKVITIPLRHITDLVVDEEAKDFRFNEESFENATRLFLVHRSFDTAADTAPRSQPTSPRDAVKSTPVAKAGSPPVKEALQGERRQREIDPQHPSFMSPTVLRRGPGPQAGHPQDEEAEAEAAMSPQPPASMFGRLMRRMGGGGGETAAAADEPAASASAPLNPESLEPREYEQEVISVITLEGQSLLFFHLWRAWMQIHMRQSASRSRSLRANAAKIKDKARSLLARKFSKKAAGDDALQGVKAAGTPGQPPVRAARVSFAGGDPPSSEPPRDERTERCAGSRFERELARKPGATFATVSAAHAAFHRCKERLLQERKQLCASTVREFMELGESVGFFMPMKRLFFQNESLWSVVVGKLKKAVELAAFSGSEPPKVEDAPIHSFRARARHHGGAVGQQHGGSRRSSRSIRRSTINRRTSIVGLEELQASWKPQPAAGLSHSEPPRPRVSSVSRSLTEADAVGDPDFTSRPVVLWEHLVGAVLCGYAAARARELMRWLVAMLDHTEGVQQRLQVFVYEGSQYSLSEIVLLAFSLDSPPTEGDRELRSGTVFDNVPKVVSDDYVDLLVSLLWNVDSISSQAHLSGLILDRFYITAPLLKVAPAMLRPKLGAMFTRLVDLLTLTPPSLDTAVVYRLAHILYSILNVMPHAVRDIVAEYEEEIKYVLSNPEVEVGLSRPGDFFLTRAVKVYVEIIAILTAALAFRSAR